MAIIEYKTDTGEIIKLGKIKPKENFTEIRTLPDGRTTSWFNSYPYSKQYLDFEEDLLEELQSDAVESFAIDKYDLISKDEVDETEKDISDFSKDEIEREYCKIMGLNLSIIQQEQLSIFTKLISCSTHKEIDDFLNEQTLKHKIL